MALWRTTGDAQDDVADALGDDDVDAVEAVNAAVEDGAVTETDTARSTRPTARATATFSSTRSPRLVSRVRLALSVATTQLSQ